MGVAHGTSPTAMGPDWPRAGSILEVPAHGSFIPGVVPELMHYPAPVRVRRAKVSVDTARELRMGFGFRAGELCPPQEIGEICEAGEWVRVENFPGSIFSRIRLLADPRSEARNREVTLRLRWPAVPDLSRAPSERAAVMSMQYLSRYVRRLRPPLRDSDGRSLRDAHLTFNERRAPSREAGEG